MYVYSCNALSTWFFDVDRALNSYFMIMIMINAAAAPNGGHQSHGTKLYWLVWLLCQDSMWSTALLPCEALGLVLCKFTHVGPFDGEATREHGRGRLVVENKLCNRRICVRLASVPNDCAACDVDISFGRFIG